MNSTANVKKALRRVISPVAYKTTQVKWQPTRLGKYRILRIVTPAWKSLPRFQRVLKVRPAIEAGLSAGEWANILRISVLTPDEMKRLPVGNGFTK